MYRHIQNFGQSCPCLQCVNICCVFVGDISFEIKTEADSNDSTDDKPSTGMIGVTDDTGTLSLISHSTFLKLGQIMNLTE